MNKAEWQTRKMRIAPLAALQEIVRQAEGLFALADQLEERLAKARRQVDALTLFLPPSPGYGGTGLARAFAGQLVPKNPTDEPASALLKRIQLRKRKSNAP